MCEIIHYFFVSASLCTVLCGTIFVVKYEMVHTHTQTQT